MFLNTDAKYIWLNGAFQPFNDTNIHLLSHTLHYGLGAFEGVRAYETESGGAIFRLRDHTERLFDAADKINITIPYSIEELEAVQKDAMTKNNLNEGYIRPIVFLGSESMGLRAKDLVSVNVAVACPVKSFCEIFERDFSNSDMDDACESNTFFQCRPEDLDDMCVKTQAHQATGQPANHPSGNQVTRQPGNQATR